MRLIRERDAAEKEGIKKGMEEGLKKGLEEGLEEGLKKGREEALIEINGISYKIKAGDTKPLFIERLIIERVIIHHTRHADHCIVMGKGRHMKKGKRVIARCNGDLVAIGKFIIECAAHIKVACLIGCCCTHRKTPFDG